MDIFTADLDGENLKRLTDTPGYDAEGSYSPDGSQIVFTSFRDGDAEIYIMDADGKNPRRITHAKGYDGGPFFSPDGKRIIYRSDRKGNDLLQVYVNNTEGTAERALTQNEFVNWGPYWHPDGRHIIYATSKHGHSNYELYLMNVDTGDEERITYHEGFDGLPVFSPDGKRLMWTSSGRTADHKSQLFIADFTLEASPLGRQGRGALKLDNCNDRTNTTRFSTQPENQTTMGPKDVIKQDARHERHHPQEIPGRPLGRRPAAAAGRGDAPDRASARAPDHMPSGCSSRWSSRARRRRCPTASRRSHDLKNTERRDSGFVQQGQIHQAAGMRSGPRPKRSSTSVPDSELDDTRDGKLPPFAPTVGVLLNMAGIHALNHSGQFVAVRRMLKKPIAF